MAAALSLVCLLSLVLPFNFFLEGAHQLLLNLLILCNLISHLFLEVLLVEVVVFPVLNSRHRWPTCVHGGLGSCCR